MKKIGKALLMVIGALVLLGALASACSGSSRSSNAGNVQSNESNAQATAQVSSASSSAAATDAADSFVGTWDMVRLEDDGTVYNKEDLKKARERGADTYIVLNEGGEAVLVMGNQVSHLSWRAIDSSHMALVSVDGETEISFALDSGKLAASGDAMVLEKGEPRSSLPSESSAASESSSADSSEQADDSGSPDEVDPELKEMLDSYEAFIDEYVEFMERYQESGDITSMLSEYTSFMQKYTDFTNKIEDVDTSSMSTADYNYYIEVTTRCAEKSLKVVSNML